MTTPTRASTQSEAKPPHDRSDSISWVGWIVTGTGVAAMGAAGYAFSRAASMNDASDSQLDTRKRQELREGANTRNLVGAVTGIAGIALATTGIVLLVTHPEGHARRDAASVSLGITNHGLIVFGRF